MKKRDKTKQQILDKAKRYFSQYGYAGVTMKDICELCDISRGGLYHHFASTKEIFLEILNQDKDDTLEKQMEAIQKKIPAELMFKWFLQQRKHSGIMGDSAGFSFAVQEFMHKEPDQHEYLRQRRQSAQDGMVILFEYGQKTGEFKVFDVDVVALTVLLLLDSLDVNAKIQEFTEDEIDRQLQLICRLVIK